MATANLAKHFQTVIGAPLLHIQRLCLIDGEPVSLDSVYLPTLLVQNVDFKSADLTTQSITSILENHGILFEEVEEHFRAALATQQISDALNIFVGEPIIRAQRYSKIKDNTIGDLMIAEYSEHYIRTDIGPVVIHSLLGKDK